MHDGMKLIIKTMLILFLVSIIIFVSLERITGTNEKILKPTEKKSEILISNKICKLTYEDKSFFIDKGTSSDCDSACSEKNYISANDCDASESSGTSCCCKCKN